MATNSYHKNILDESSNGCELPHILEKEKELSTRLKKFNLKKSRNVDRLFRIKIKYYSQTFKKTSVRYGKRSKKLVFRPINKISFKTTNISIYRNQLRNFKEFNRMCIEPKIESEEEEEYE